MINNKTKAINARKPALFYGRFQPFHNGHLSVIEKIVENGHKDIVIGISSCQEQFTLKNPFNYFSRKDMIWFSVLKLKNELGIGFSFIDLYDINNPKQWPYYVTTRISNSLDKIPFSIYTCEKKEAENWKKYKETLELKHFDINLLARGFDFNISATKIRKILLNEHNFDWYEQVPKPTIQIIERDWKKFKDLYCGFLAEQF